MRRERERALYAVARILERTRETEMRRRRRNGGRREEGRKEDVEGQDGRRGSSNGAVQSSTKKSVGPPHRRSSLLLIPTAVLRLYLVPPSSSNPSPFPASFPPRSPLYGRRSSPFLPFCFSLSLALPPTVFSLLLAPLLSRSRHFHRLVVFVPPT